MRPFTRTLANGEEYRIPVEGATIYMQSTTAALIVTARRTQRDRQGNQSGRELANNVSLPDKGILQWNRGDRGGEYFDEVTIRNESGGSVNFVADIGYGDISDPPSAVSTQVPNSQSSTADATAGAAAAEIVAANANRRRVHIGANGNNTQYVRIGDSNITATRGVQLGPGMAITIEGTQAIYAIREAAGTVDIWILEEERT